MTRRGFFFFFFFGVSWPEQNVTAVFLWCLLCRDMCEPSWNHTSCPGRGTWRCLCFLLIADVPPGQMIFNVPFLPEHSVIPWSCCYLQAGVCTYKHIYAHTDTGINMFNMYLWVPVRVLQTSRSCGLQRSSVSALCAEWGRNYTGAQFPEAKLDIFKQMQALRTYLI